MMSVEVDDPSITLGELPVLALGLLVINVNTPNPEKASTQAKNAPKKPKANDFLADTGLFVADDAAACV